MSKTTLYTSHQAQQRGFTLVEIAVVVTVIGILAALAIPYYKRAKESSQISSFEHDLRLYEQEFDTYELENGFYPPSQPTAGALPLDMADRLSPTWKLPSPIGGEYRWVYTTESDPKARTAYIEIVNTPDNPVTIDIARLIEVDEDLDDGVVTTGRVRLSGLNVRYIVR